MNTYVTTGTLTDASTVHLDEPVPQLEGKVRVTVEILDAAPPKQTLNEWLESVRLRREASGVTPLSDAQIEEWVREARSGRGS